ncbi:LysR family transcriptional regulator [Sphingomonas sp. DBB INV C78]|uniref:LysR family transcriptional regulator n=1 Tax=Sphingomonas sp. DBB INV C78 TaxID=3349434 RepID=UPI0036D2778A
MELRQLRYFRQIAESGSISAASAILRIAQPALSRQVRVLEHELGAQLFLRNGRGVSLTSTGRALFAEALQLLEEADRISRHIRSLGTRLTGEATIGLSPTIGRLLTLPLARRVQLDFPGLQLRIAEAFSGTLLEWLQAGRIDAAILYHRPASAIIRSELVAREPLSILGAVEDAPFPPGEIISMSQVAGRPLVLPTPSHGLRMMIEDHAATAGAVLNVMFEFDSLDATIALVRQGAALTILPESAVRQELALGQLRAWQIGDPPLFRPLIIATATQRPDAIGSREIAALLKETILTVAREGGWRVSNAGPRSTGAGTKHSTLME